MRVWCRREAAGDLGLILPELVVGVAFCLPNFLLLGAVAFEAQDGGEDEEDAEENRDKGDGNDGAVVAARRTISRADWHGVGHTHVAIEPVLLLEAHL